MLVIFHSNMDCVRISVIKVVRVGFSVERLVHGIVWIAWIVMVLGQRLRGVPVLGVLAADSDLVLAFSQSARVAGRQLQNEFAH